MEWASLVTAIFAALVSALVGYFGWRHSKGTRATANRALTASENQAESLGAQAVELERIRKIAEEAHQGTQRATLKLVRVAKVIPDAGGFLASMTDTLESEVKNLGPAPAHDVWAEEIHIGNAIYNARQMGRWGRASVIGPGESHVFRFDAGGKLNPLRPVNTRVKVVYRDGAGQRSVLLSFP